MYKNVLSIFSSFIPLQNEDVNLIKSLFIHRSVKRDLVLIDNGELSNSIFFINSGYLRAYKTIETGEEQTLQLFSPGDFAGSCFSFVNNTRSEEVLHTITDADLLCISKNDLDKLFATDTKWQIFGRKLMELLLLEKENRITNQISLTAQDRYKRLLETKPDLIQNIPIQFVASYIGIQPESLSRIRKQIFLTNVK